MTIALSSIVFLFCFALLIWQEIRFDKERREWREERRNLLDRIQAKSFAEYAAKEIKEKRIEKQSEEEPPRVEFVS
jgi:hypothetical protein